MKRLILLSFLLPLSLALLAQSTYTSSDYGAVSDTFVISTVNSGLGSLDFAATGANFSWNFDSLDIFDQNTIRIEDPDNTGYYLTWFTGCLLNGGSIFNCPGTWAASTNQAIGEFDSLGLGGIQLSGATTFYRKTSTTYEATIYGVSVGIGGFSLPLAVDYEKIDTIYQFPLNYLDVDSSESRLVFEASNGGQGITNIQDQKRVNEVDGWGSLTTPFKSYPSVLRMKTLLFNADTLILNGTTIPTNTTAVEYKWFDPATGYPVMIARGNQTFLGEIITSVEFVDTLRCLEPNASFLFFPPVAFVDSTTGVATINFLNQSGNSDLFTWNFGDGTSSSSQNPNKEFAPGVYLVELIACNSRCLPLLCDTTFLPVTVLNPFAPVALFSTNPADACVNTPVTFINNSFNGQSYAWDFGDNVGTSTAEEPTYTYTATGSYEVRLIITNGQFRDTTTNTIVVNDLPNPDLGQDTLFLAVNASQALTPGTFQNYVWSSGDTDPSILIDGQQIGVDTVIYWVDVMDGNDCMARDSVVVIVTPATSVEERAPVNIQLYPNPVSENLYVVIPQEVNSVLSCQITDLRGKVIHQQKMRRGRTYQVAVDTWPLGFYLIRLQGEGVNVTKKFLIED
ncbi:MAG: PKD domain-containing protein [Bacteroidota bacterium]